MRFEPAAIESLQALMLGFAFAGLMASAFELLTERRASFKLLESGGLTAVACVPVVVFSAPYIIVRNTVLGTALGQRPFFFVFAATVIACLWSLMSGRVVRDLALALIGV
jgi:hypothetical protein